ncbi:hypothetical protein ACFWMU_34325 [Streptomyces sp. NPDC058357]
MKLKGQRHLYALDLGVAPALTAVYVGFAGCPPTTASPPTQVRPGSGF